MRRRDKLKAVLTSLFIFWLLAGILPAGSPGSCRLGRSLWVTNRVAQFSSTSPADIRCSRNDAEDCPGVPWFDAYTAIVLHSSCGGYVSSLRRETLSLWSPEAGHGRSRPFRVRSFQL